MENRATYKRIKANWWVIILFGGFHVWIIFAYIIYQRGVNPHNTFGLIIVSIIWIFVYIIFGWRKVIIGDKFIILRAIFPLYNKLAVDFVKIEDVSIANVSIASVMYWSMCTLYLNTGIRKGMIFPEKYPFDFVKQTIIIKLKNGETYQIAIKDAEKIKEEIEKRMITTN